MRKHRLRGLIGSGVAVFLIVIAVYVGRPYVNMSSNQRGWELTLDGHEALMEGRDEQAMRMLESAIKRVPDSEIAWQNLGVAYERLGRLQEAQAAFSRSKEISSRKPEAPENPRQAFGPFDEVLGGNRDD